MICFDIKNLNLYYGSFQAFKGIGMEIEAGNITAFIGPSGCGKSTLLKSLNRMNDNIAFGPRTRGIKSKYEVDKIVEESLRGAAIWDEVKDRLKKSALGLSGGQQQRICIARALAVQPSFFLLGEVIEYGGTKNYGGRWYNRFEPRQGRNLCR